MNQELTTKLLELDPSDAMKAALDANIFYVEVIECIGGYSTGSVCEDVPVPSLKPSLAEAQAEVDEMVSEYQYQIEQGERDADDEYEGFVMKARINPNNPDYLDLIDGEHVIHTESLKSLTGV